MIYEVFSVYDAKAEAFLPPFILPKQAQAKRAFSQCVNSPDHQFGANPDDYTLFSLGNFNDEDGQHLLHRAKQSLGNGVEYVRMDSEQATEGRSNGKDESSPKVSPRTPLQSSSPGENPPE
jgi:hypothetical protein